jgi:hypothetical protein
MGYYQGDYYRGARGDPFWGALLGGLKRVGGMLLGAPLGGGAPAAAGMAGKVMAGGKMAVQRVGSAIIKHPVISAAGAAGAMGALGGAGVEKMMMAAGEGHRGFHLCKSKHGCKSGQWVRNRRMNPCNVKALRRAARRAHGFLRISKKLVHYYTPKAHKGKAFIRTKRRA